MCIVCRDWLRGKMTFDEAIRALGEMVREGDFSEENLHMKDLKEKIEGYKAQNEHGETD